MTEDRRERDRRYEQETADRALRKLFAGRPYPDLPPFFAARCTRHATFAPTFRSLGPVARIVLGAYWALTLGVACALLIRADWPATVSPLVAGGLLTSIAVPLAPVVIFADMRGGLSSLLGGMLG